MASNKDKTPAKKKKFLALPKYPGGSSAFKRFLSDNLSYPDEALQNKIEGDVYVKFRVSDLGVVIEAHIEKGLGHGCDEEALRVVRLLRYESVKNRGIRVQSSMRTKIPFRLSKTRPAVQVVYAAPAVEKKNIPEEKVPDKKSTVYSYTIHYPKKAPDAVGEAD